MEYFESEEKFLRSFEGFNVLLYGGRWETPNAQKDHEDIYGQKICRGETYFKLQVGGSFTSYQKVSTSSMEKMLYLVMRQNRSLEKMAEDAVKKQFDGVIEALNRRVP